MRLGLKLLALLIPLAAIAATPPAASQFCFFIDQHCVACGRDLAKQCTFYECEDGSTPVSCTQCSIFCPES